MASRLKLLVLFVLVICEIEGKLQDNKTESGEVKPVPKKQQMVDSAAMMFADELKVTLERYLFGICPQTYKVGLKKNTTSTCELDTEQQDLPGRLATLALRAHSAARVDCSRLGVALANTLGELARTAASRHTFANAAAHAAASEAAKKRKLSKSQKAKIQAKQRTALAVKKKAAAIAAAQAAKMAA